MNIIKKLSFLFLFLSPLFAFAQTKMNVQDYIEKYKDDAVHDMKKTGVPASITLAQALLESQAGNSEIAQNANNHFGIKCHNDWTGATYNHDDDAKDECFRKYKSVLESYDDHSEYLKRKERYAFLFDLDITDYEGWAKGLKKAGYATNPQYAELLIKLIEVNGLFELDRGGSLPVTSSDKNDVASISKTNPAVVAPAVYKSSSSLHQVLLNNDVKYVIAKPGDSYVKIAKEFDMGLWQIFKYNELEKNATIKEGQLIFIKPKRRSGTQEFYTVKQGDTMYSISQKFAMKIRLLYNKNRMDSGAEPKPGQVLWLKNRKPGI